MPAVIALLSDIAFSEGWEQLDMAKLRGESGGLLEKVKALKPLSWKGELTAKQMKELINLRTEWRAGHISAGPKAVHEAFVKHVGREVVGESGFRRFLGKKPKGQ